MDGWLGFYSILSLQIAGTWYIMSETAYH